MSASSTLSESLNDLRIWRRRPSPSLPPPRRGVQLRVAPRAHNHPRLSLHLSPKPHPHHGTQPKPSSVPLHHCLPRLPASPTFASCLLPALCLYCMRRKATGWGARATHLRAAMEASPVEGSACGCVEGRIGWRQVEEEGGARWRCHRRQCDRSACDGASERRRRTVLVGEGHGSLLPSTRRLCQGAQPRGGGWRRRRGAGSRHRSRSRSWLSLRCGTDRTQSTVRRAEGWWQWRDRSGRLGVVFVWPPSRARLESSRPWAKTRVNACTGFNTGSQRWLREERHASARDRRRSRETRGELQRESSFNKEDLL
jgi:hypothetical protein